METLKIESIKSGILVIQVIKISGGISYIHEEEETYFDGNSHIKKWKATSIIENANERKTVLKVKADIYNLLRKLCIKTPIGLICKEEDKDKLVEIFKVIKEKRDLFNNEATTCQLIVHNACYEVKGDDYQTVSIILEQVNDMCNQIVNFINIDDLKALQRVPKRFLKGLSIDQILNLPLNERDLFIGRAKAELIRKVLKDNKGIENLLPQKAESRVKEVITEAKVISRRLCGRVERREHSLESTINQMASSEIVSKRFKLVTESSETQQENLKENISPISILPARKWVR